ncbi:MAG TPA: DedA family protein [Candidatus Nanoarchaeia archaeon]|nr:DedA family protein [Candidatus Nanoarchaeia archaeon]
MAGIISFFANLDRNIAFVIQNYGVGTYLILFAIIFLETGIVLAPLLPGDSLIFVSGTLAAQGLLNVFLLFALLSLAAILGDSANYWIGHYLGARFFKKSRLFSRKYFDRAHEFYEKHGGKTIVIARFIPIIRTFAPFVAGIGRMNYARFLFYNIFGGILWVFIFLFAGFYFGTLSFVQKNLALVILLIIIISLLPAIIEFLRIKLGKNK